MGRRDKRDTMFTFMIYSSQRRCCACCFCPYFLQLRNKSGEFVATLLQHWLEREEGWSAGCLPVYLLTWKQGKIFIFDKSEVQTYFPPSFWQGRIIACVYIMPPTMHSDPLCHFVQDARSKPREGLPCHKDCSNAFNPSAPAPPRPSQHSACSSCTRCFVFCKKRWMLSYFSCRRFGRKIWDNFVVLRLFWSEISSSWGRRQSLYCMLSQGRGLAGYWFTLTGKI